MKQIITAPLLALILATPATAQDEPSLMEQGAKQFVEGLLQEMAPALDELTQLMEDAGPALQDFMAEMGPKLSEVLEEVEDWSAYEAPQVQPNGDIIIRRKPDTPKITPEEQMPQIDL